MNANHSISDHDLLVVILEVAAGTQANELHELLNKAINESDLVALNALRLLIHDIVVR